MSMCLYMCLCVTLTISWCQHIDVAKLIGSMQEAAPPLPCTLTKVQPLYPLPQNYSELIKKASSFR